MKHYEAPWATSLIGASFYYKKPLGSYRAYVTDLRRCVILRYAKRRIVISPANPGDFASDLALAKP